MTIGPLEIVQLTLRHKTNEDWYLELPVSMPEDQTLEGVQVRAVLERNGVEIVFEDDACRVEGSKIVMDLQSESFTGKMGTFKGDVLLRFPNGFDISSHEITVELKKGITQWSK